jgi:signal transduction histidine kinase/CheY-like chemotaxis protein
MTRARGWRDLGVATLVFLAYVGAGKLGLRLAFVHASASAVWAPTGISLAAFLLLGPRVWPAIFTGALAVNLTTAGAVATSLGIAAGNTLEGLAGAYLVGRFAGGKRAFESPQGLLAFVALGGLLAPAVSATVGVSSLVLGGEAPGAAAPWIWLTWWLGDAAGALIVTPAIVHWALAPRLDWSRSRRLEAALLLVAAIAAAVFVFTGASELAQQRYPVAFLCMPPLVWAAFRFGPRVAAALLCLLCGVAVWGTLQGLGPFSTQRPGEALVLLQAFMGTTAVVTLLMATLVSSWRRTLRERTASEAAATLARVEAETASRLKDEFLATLSHELRTPLNAIVGWSRLLLEGRHSEADVQRALRVIDRNARAQVQIIEDILDVSRIVTGALRLDPRPLDLRALLEEGLDVVRPAAAAKEIAVGADLGRPVPLVADPRRLQQVFWNLLSNAVKFTPAGGRIDVRLRGSPDGVEVEVMDSGPGIHPDFLPHVFERFRQADSTASRAHGGLGLGLAIVRHLVELHGGTVRAENRGDREGSVFTVRLPLAADREDAAPPAAGGAAPPPRLDGLRVLAVDDDDDALELLTLALERAGAAVSSARSASECLAALGEHRPDVLVCDIGMPQEDGHELIRRVRALGEPALAGVPAVALTAYASGEDRRRAAAAGFDAYLAKPVEPAALSATIAAVARRDRPAAGATPT